MRRFRTSTAGAVGLAMLMLAPAAGYAAGGHHQPGEEAATRSAPEGARLAHMADGAGMMAPGHGIGTGPCQGYGPGYGMRPGMMMAQGMGSGMMGPGMMGPGMMGPGMMGPGMMGPGMMGQGAPGQGYGMGPGMTAPGQGYGPGMMGRGMGPGMMGPGIMTPGMGPSMMMPGPMGPGMMIPDQGHGAGPGMMTPSYGLPQGYGMGPGVGPSQDLSVDDVRARLERSLAWHGNPRLAIGDVTETDEDTITADIVTRDGSLVQRFLVDRHSGAMRMAE